MEVLYLAGSVQALFLATLFISRRQSLLPQRILVAFFLINGLLLLDHYFELSGTLFQNPHLLGITYPLPIILGPVILFYTRVVTKETAVSTTRFFGYHAWPFVLALVFLLFNYYHLSGEEKLEFYYEQSTGDTSIAIYFIELFLNLSIPLYSIWSLLELWKHKRKIHHRFSFTENINLKWLEIILVLFSGISLLMLITNLISDVFPLIDYQIGDNIIFGGLTISIFFIGYFGIRQKAIYANEDKQPDPGGINSASVSGQMISDAELDQLIRSMEVDQLYLNSKLSLKNVADHLNVSENNLSQLINVGLKKNFYDFVNEYRVEDVKSKIVDSKFGHLSFLGIAFDSGFNSKSSFNNIFKRHTKMTPSEFKRTCLKESKSTGLDV
ncbi:MAG: helix-turn-helix domain-containing protein [Cyclobacteriaceae bacterium]